MAKEGGIAVRFAPEDFRPVRIHPVADAPGEGEREPGVEAELRRVVRHPAVADTRAEDLVDAGEDGVVERKVERRVVAT